MSKESQLGNLNISQNVFLPCLPFCPLRLWVTPSVSNPKPHSNTFTNVDEIDAQVNDV